eukprot:UN32857
MFLKGPKLIKTDDIGMAFLNSFIVAVVVVVCTLLYKYIAPKIKNTWDGMVLRNLRNYISEPEHYSSEEDSYCLKEHQPSYPNPQAKKNFLKKRSAHMTTTSKIEQLKGGDGDNVVEAQIDFKESDEENSANDLGISESLESLDKFQAVPTRSTLR